MPQPGAEPVRLAVSGMTCHTCEETLERAIGRVPGVRSVRADREEGAVAVWLDSAPPAGAIGRAIEGAGYDLKTSGMG